MGLVRATATGKGQGMGKLRVQEGAGDFTRTYRQGGEMRSKADILIARGQEAEVAALDNTPIPPRPNGEVMRCAGCGEHLPTEGAFARHFLVPDERYLNLGNCPIGRSQSENNEEA
jgi:hypothetical protein